ncbi:MAG: glycosyltransferase family 4 protein [Pseudomonas sp.]|nr:glycosyltransferase family 4 protein [Pseudomonas sp.]
MNKIKVLQLHPKYNIKKTDISDLGEQIFKALPDDRFTTVNGFFAGRPTEDEPISCADQSIYFDFTDKQLKGLRITALWTLYKYLKKEQFDVVICNRYKPVNMLLTLSRFLNIPLCIGIAHGFGDYDRAYRRKQVKKRINKNWKFVGVSPAVKDYLLGLKSGFTEKNTVSITNAIDTEKAKEIILDKSTARAELALDQSIEIIGALGRLVPLKGHANLIKAFAAISMDYPNAHLAIIGDGREKNNLHNLILELNLAGRVHLLGFQPDAIRLAKAFDIWVMPSFKEGLGLALLEGMCAKLPIIASDVPAMLPLIKGAGGLVIDPHNIKDIADALRDYLDKSAQDRVELGENAYKYLVNNHSIKEFKIKYLELIENGLKNNE